MANSKRWLLTENIGVVLEIETLEGDTLKYRVVQYTSYNALNEMPQASCLLAIGEAPLKDPLDRITTSAEKLRTQGKAKVKLTLIGEYDLQGTKWPGKGEEQVIFDGYFAGCNYQRNQGRVFLQVQLTHWLAALAFTTTLNQSVHPAGAASLAFPVSQQATGTGDLATKPFRVGDAIPEAITPQSIALDVWGALKDFLYAYAGSQPMEFEGDFAQLVFGQIAPRNDLAREALARIEGGLGTIDEAKPGVRDIEFGLPLPLSTTNVVADTIFAEAIHASVANQVNATYGAGTIWEKLISHISSAFDLHLVPMIDRALMVPVTPGLSFSSEEEPWRDITPDEYAVISMQSGVGYPLRAVVVSNDQGRVNTNAALRQVSFNGVFMPDDIPSTENGSILFVQAPPWMQGIETAAFRQSSSGIVAANELFNTAETPQILDVSTVTLDNLKGAAATEYDYLGRYARSLYVQRALSGRTATISGKLRFDISPGSTIKLQGKPELFTGDEDNLAEDQYGLVVRTVIMINAEQAEASTTFQMTHMRNITETQSGYCVNEHPFYNKRFLGAPLLPIYDI